MHTMIASDQERHIYNKTHRLLTCPHTKSDIRILDMYKIDNVWTEVRAECARCHEEAMFIDDTSFYYNIHTELLKG